MSSLKVSSGVSRILSGDDALNPTTLKVYRKRYDEYQTFCASSGDELKEEEHLLEFFNKKHETIGELRPWFSAINHFFKTVNGGTTMQAKYPSFTKSGKEEVEEVEEEGQEESGEEEEEE